MSIGCFAIGQMPISAQSAPAAVSGSNKPPRLRQTVAKADTTAAPEPR